MTDYGPLAGLVAYGGNLTAGAVALRAAWGGRLAWEPKIANLNKAPTRFAGVITAIAIGTIFAYTRASPDWKWVVPWAIASGAIGFIGMIGYVILLATNTLQCPGSSERYIRGFWLTRRAENILKGTSPEDLVPGQLPPSDVTELFCESGKRPERIWPPLAQGLAQAALVAAYIAFIAPTTIAIGTGAVILEKSLKEASAAATP